VKLRLWNMSARDNLNMYVFMLVLIVVGAVFGVLLASALTLDQQQELADQMDVYLSSIRHADQFNHAAAFWDSFIFYGKWLGLIWLLGVSVIGLPLVLVLDFLKGMLIGFAVALLVDQLAWKGVLFFLVSTALPNAIVVPALLIASVSASRFAFFLVRERLFRKKGQLLPPFLAHTAVTGLMLVVLLCAALYEAFVAPVLLSQVAPQVDAQATNVVRE